MEYTLKRVSRSRSIKIRLTNEGVVVASAPRYLPKIAIDAFVHQTEPWIKRQLERLKLKQLANPSLSWDEGTISYLGKLYYIKFRTTGDKVSFEGGVCWVNPVTKIEADTKRTLVMWLNHNAKADISMRVSTWAKIMKARYGEVRFGQQISRWGSCSGDNNLRFNWRLIHFPAEVIDYVVIHELAHTVHHDHSDNFWKLVEQHCPTWRTQRNFLKRQAIKLEKL